MTIQSTDRFPRRNADGTWDGDVSLGELAAAVGSSPDLIDAAPIAGQLGGIKISSATPTSGTLRLRLNGETTVPIAFDATQAEWVHAFGALPSVGAGNVTVIDAFPVSPELTLLDFGVMLVMVNAEIDVTGVELLNDTDDPSIDCLGVAGVVGSPAGLDYVGRMAVWSAQESLYLLTQIDVFGQSAWRKVWQRARNRPRLVASISGPFTLAHNVDWAGTTDFLNAEWNVTHNTRDGAFTVDGRHVTVTEEGIYVLRMQPVLFGANLESAIWQLNNPQGDAAGGIFPTNSFGEINTVLVDTYQAEAGQDVSQFNLLPKSTDTLPVTLNQLLLTVQQIG